MDSRAEKAEKIEKRMTRRDRRGSGNQKASGEKDGRKIGTPIDLWKRGSTATVDPRSKSALKKKKQQKTSSPTKWGHAPKTSRPKWQPAP